MAVNINGDTGIDKVQPGTIDSADFGPGSVTAPAIASGAVTSAKLDTNLSIPGTMTATSFSGDGSSLTGIAGGFSNMDVFTSPGTWTNPGNVQKVKVTVVGGGGAGGYSTDSNWGGKGGGGGGAAIEIVPFPTATNVPVTVGPGGTSGNTAPSVSNSGGTSSFGAYCSATGGGGGGAPNYNVATQALGGTGSGGQLNMGGGDGQTGAREGSGAGGTSIFGGAGRGTDTQLDSVASPAKSNTNGNSYGGGGGGALVYAADHTGGTGAAGVVVVEY